MKQMRGSRIGFEPRTIKHAMPYNAHSIISTYCHYSEYCCSAPMRAAVVCTPPPPPAPGGGKNKEGYVPQLSSLYIIPAR